MTFNVDIWHADLNDHIQVKFEGKGHRSKLNLKL